MSNIWKTVEATLTTQLDQEDDRALWETVLRVVFEDTEALAQQATAGTPVIAEIGRCSHWLRPHQTRWVADGGFAWPSGYGGFGYSRFGLPEFDWSILARWSSVDRRWESQVDQSAISDRKLNFRIAIPSRTAQRDQAAVHTIWKPGPPQHPRKELVQLYGFRRLENSWEQTAYSALPDENAYEQQIPTDD